MPQQGVENRHEPLRQREEIVDPNRPSHRTKATKEAFSLETRRLAFLHALAGEWEHLIVTNKRDVAALPCTRTLLRHLKRFLTRGHFCACKRNGGKARSVLAGNELIHVAVCRGVFPTATCAEVQAHLWNVHGRFLPRPRVHGPSQITRAEQRIGLSRKRTSTTARQAFLPRNTLRRRNYWTQNCPFGIADIPSAMMIDIDEAVVNICDSERSHGKTTVNTRSQQNGPCTREGESQIILAISGCPINGRRWMQCDEDPSGATVVDFPAFVWRVLIDLGPGTPGNRHCVTLDNPNVHHNPMVLYLIHACGHRFAFLAPHWPIDAPIECVFNAIELGLTMNMCTCHNSDDIRRSIVASLRTMPTFDAFFRHCGCRQAHCVPVWSVPPSAESKASKQSRGLALDRGAWESVGSLFSVHQ